MLTTARTRHKRLIMVLQNFLWVALGGALGASARYGLSIIFQTGFSFATMLMPILLINIIGSFAMGIIAAWLDRNSVAVGVSESLRFFVMIGLLGGFTTFSAVSYELFLLLERRDYWLAGAYGGGSVILALLGFIGGVGVVRAI